MSIDHAASPYNGPVRKSLVRAGGKWIHLVRPADPDQLLDDPAIAAWNQRNDYMPYWAYLWPGSFLLADAIVAGRWPARTTTLELGCGLGLPGLVALSMGLAVEFTDYDRTPLGFVTQSAAANGFDPSLYSVSLLDWRQPTADQFGLILGADITYERRLIPLVTAVIAAKLAPGGVALITDPNRTASEGFAAQLHDSGLTAEIIPAEAECEGEVVGSVRGTIYRIRHRSP